MTPENKTLHWEYIVSQRSYLLGNNTPIERRSTNEIQFPGTTKIENLKNEWRPHQSTVLPFRYLATLRDIVRGHNNKDCDELLKMTDSSFKDRDQSFDELLRKIDDDGVGLRLDV